MLQCCNPGDIVSGHCVPASVVTLQSWCCREKAAGVSCWAHSAAFHAVSLHEVAPAKRAQRAAGQGRRQAAESRVRHVFFCQLVPNLGAKWHRHGIWYWLPPVPDWCQMALCRNGDEAAAMPLPLSALHTRFIELLSLTLVERRPRPRQNATPTTVLRAACLCCPAVPHRCRLSPAQPAPLLFRCSQGTAPLPSSLTRLTALT